VRVSVFTPLESTLVVISELSGPGRVVGAVASAVVAAFALLFAFAASFVFEHPAINAAKQIEVTMQSFLITLLSSSGLGN
jgi:hypothetical protein